MPDGAKPSPGGWNRIHLIVADIATEVARLRDAGVSFRLAGQTVEVLQVQDHAVRVVKLAPPVGRSPSPPLQTTGEQASSIS